MELAIRIKVPMMEIPEKHCWDRTYVINRFFFGHRIIYDINVMQQIDTFGHFYKTDRLSFLYGVFTVSTVVGLFPNCLSMAFWLFLPFIVFGNRTRRTGGSWLFCCTSLSNCI